MVGHPETLLSSLVINRRYITISKWVVEFKYVPTKTWCEQNVAPKDSVPQYCGESGVLGVLVPNHQGSEQIWLSSIEVK